MILRDFIHHFVTPNTLIRLWYPVRQTGCSNYEMSGVMCMEHELVKNINYSELEVIGVTDILVRGDYVEAVNIVVKRMTLDKVREIKLNSLITDRGWKK